MTKTPEDWLNEVSPEKPRGIFKLFLGYAPGVGKTYNMLSEAIRGAAATVRATCVRTLGKMKANTYPVVSVVLTAKNDPDGRVRAEADEAGTILAPGAASPSPAPQGPATMIQPTGAVLPRAGPAPSGPSLPALPMLPPALK